MSFPTHPTRISVLDEFIIVFKRNVIKATVAEVERQLIAMGPFSIHAWIWIEPGEEDRGEETVAVRKRQARKSRSIMQLDLKKLYVGGLAADISKAIETPLPNEADFEIDFCGQILCTDSNHVEAMVLLGDAYTRKGDYAKGLELDLRLSAIKPESELIRYNLACSYALTGQKDKAINCLDKAIELGYRDVEHLRQDHDLDAIKADPRFQNMIKKLSAEPENSPHQ